jgi:glutamate synthase domain-containing protein 3
MMRVCHLNTCPVGVATQDPDLRRKFAGKPEHVINYFFFVAEEVRQIMAQLGFRTMQEMIGQTQHLEFADVSDHWKARHLDLSVILHKPDVPDTVAVRNVTKQDHGLEQSLDHTKLIELARPALQQGQKVRAEMPISNINRTVGTTLSGEIGKRYGFGGLPDDTIHFKFHGSAGQSFGCFAARGLTLEIEGDANDYLGKGLSGGKIIAYPPKKAAFKAEENIIAGNVIAYGAIAGELYLRGVVGERFCVRNSGAAAVVEGVGDHGCEYMTGGLVIVIGPTGRNFAAGMSGGIAYVYDSLGNFPSLCNMEMVELEKVEKQEDVEFVRRMLENHWRYTGSPVAKGILDDFANEVRWFVKVMPTDYRRVLEHLAEVEAAAAKLSESQTAGV